LVGGLCRLERELVRGLPERRALDRLLGKRLGIDRDDVLGIFVDDGLVPGRGGEGLQRREEEVSGQGMRG
jgi:hypothetical protein